MLKKEIFGFRKKWKKSHSCSLKMGESFGKGFSIVFALKGQYNLARGNAPGKIGQQENRPRKNVEKRDNLISDEIARTKKMIINNIE